MHNNICTASQALARMQREIGMGLKRREFLGRVAQALWGLGLIDAATLRYGVDAIAASPRYPYYQVAQPTGRKLALLVGINQYPSTQSLSGCLTDVELQTELLIHRFGFKAADILTLSEQQATRQQIESAFIEHLTKQVQPGDVVVFHFSGYGRRVENRAGGSEGAEEAGGVLSIQNPKSKIQNSLAERRAPLAFNSLVGYDGEDLLEETLWLLLRSLSTTHITTILDTSFNPGKILPGNLQIRSFPQLFDLAITQAELDFQTIEQTKLQSSIIPGIVLHATNLTGSATEARWNGFSAGLFTYALTQYLWSATPPTTVQVSLGRVRSVVEQLVEKQQPQLSGHQDRNLTYYLNPESNIGADGVVRLVEEDGKTAQLWLAGILPTVLEYYETGSKFTLVPPQAGAAQEPQSLGSGENEQSKIQNSQAASPQPPAPSLQLRSRSGLIAKAQIVGDSNNLQVGQLVQEAIRVLPRNIRLSIALDPSLERIERVDATSAFATIPYVSIVTAQEMLVDYVFGRISESPETPTTTLTTSSPNRYGLFSLEQKLIPTTAGELGEVVKFAVQRLSPKVQTLLAAKLWRLTTNEASSLLNVKATLEIMDGDVKVLMQRETQRFVSSELVAIPPRGNLISTDICKIPIGSRIQYRVRNDGDCPVYLLLLGLDPSKNAIAFFSGTNPTEDDPNPKSLVIDLAIAPGDTLIIPPPAVDSQWVMRKPTGLTEHQLIFSTAKFSQTVAALSIAGQNTEDSQYIGALSNPLEVAQAMMLDLHLASTTREQTTASNTDTLSSTANTYSLDVNHWASLSFVYQVT